jgi:hypothetical protein
MYMLKHILLPYLAGLCVIFKCIIERGQGFRLIVTIILEALFKISLGGGGGNTTTRVAGAFE